MAKQISAGLLMYRRVFISEKYSINSNLFDSPEEEKEVVEVLLVHPGGPFFRNKDKGYWTIPKGLVDEGEELLDAAKREFEEEMGIKPTDKEAKFIELGSVTQASGKVIHAWAFEFDLPENFVIASNSFEIEWPPKSGKRQSFPEIDKYQFFTIEEAKEKINQYQSSFLDKLEDLLE